MTTPLFDVSLLDGRYRFVRRDEFVTEVYYGGERMPTEDITPNSSGVLADALVAALLELAALRKAGDAANFDVHLHKLRRSTETSRDW